MYRLFSVFFVLLLIYPAGNFAFANPPDGLTTSTSNPTYEPGDQVIITGTVQPVTDNNPVTIIVRNPIGNVYAVGQIPLNNNMFVDEFVLGDNAQGGLYTVNIRQDNKTTQIQFQVITGLSQIIPVYESKIRVSGQNDDLIKYGNVQVSTALNSITISVDTSKMRNGPVMETFHIPKRVVDTNAGGLVVQEGGNIVSCTQRSSDVERVLDCPITKGITQITITGTSVIPEFGLSASLVFASSIAVAVIIFSKIRGTVFSDSLFNSRHI